MPSTENERIVKQFNILYGRSSILLPKDARVISVSQLHDIAFLNAIVRTILVDNETRIFHLIETQRAFEWSERLHFIGGIFANRKNWSCFEEIESL